MTFLLPECEKVPVPKGGMQEKRFRRGRFDVIMIP